LESKYKYYRLGNPTDISPQTQPGFALMGGGKRQDNAFQWLCHRSNGGDFLILGAADTQEYNGYVSDLCKENSVATFVLTSREAAQDPFVADTIRKAEAVFIMGGDQANYVKSWQGTPVQDALNDLIRRGIPVGGNSAGLAILGEFSFSALRDSAYSKETLQNPYNDRVTITSDFLQIPPLRSIITDTHFVKRDRLGRLLGFMARITQDGESKHIRAIAVDQDNTVLLDADGHAEVTGTGRGAYFYRPTRRPDVCSPGTPLSYQNIEVYHAPVGGTFNVTRWDGAGGTSYTLSVLKGEIHSTQSDGGLY
jgi:cyanophycinase